MKPLKELLEEKKQIKKKLPSFKRQESARRKKLGTKWRKPKGVQSKLRLRRRGKPAMVSIGYKTFSKLRHSNEEGKFPFLISSFSDLNSFDSEKNFAILSSKIGNKKRLQIFEKAKKQKISFSNIRDIDASIKKIKSEFEARKTKKKQRLEKKKKREQERKKKDKKTAEIKKKPKVDEKKKQEILSKIKQSAKETQKSESQSKKSESKKTKQKPKTQKPAKKPQSKKEESKK